MTATVSTVKDDTYYEKEEVKNEKSKKPRKDIENYYNEQNQAIGRWLGSGADALGLEGDIHSGEFLKMIKGIHPKTNDKVWENKKLKYNATDMTCSAVKDFSVLWAIGDDEMKDKLSAIHDKAVNRAVAKASNNLYRRLNSKNEKAFDVMPIVAVFNHTTARPTDKRPDPQKHSHCVFFRRCLVKKNDKLEVYTIDNHSLFQNQKLYGATYRAELANGLRDLGFEIQPMKDEVEQVVFKKSKDGVVEEFRKERVDSFRVKGLSREITDHFSNRGNAIKKIAEDSGNTSGVSKYNIAKNIRRSKQVCDEQTLHNIWKDEAKILFNFDNDAIQKLRTYKKDELGYNAKNEKKIIKDAMYKGKLFEGKLRLRLAEYEQTSGINAENYFNSLVENNLISRSSGFLFDVNFDLKDVDVMNQYMKLKKKTINSKLIENVEFMQDNIYILPILLLDLIKETFIGYRRRKDYFIYAPAFSRIGVRNLISLKPVFSDINDDVFVALISRIADKEKKLMCSNKSTYELIKLRYEIDELKRELAMKREEKNKVKWVPDID